MVRYEIASSERDELIIRIFDAPANGWRTLFIEEDGLITRYEEYENARSGVRIYDSSDKTILFEAELEVYLKSANTGMSLGICGLPSLVRFGERGHFVYATFTLAEQFIKQSELKIIGYRGEEAVYSAGWAAPVG